MHDEAMGCQCFPGGGQAVSSGTQAQLLSRPLHLLRDALLLRQGEAIFFGEDFAGEIVEGVADDVLAGAGAEDDARRCHDLAPGSELQLIFFIHREQPGGGSADGGLAGDASRDSLEVFRPNILARMEEAAHFTSVWVDAGEVRALVQIAARTGEGEILQDGCSTVLSGDDVLHMEGHQRVILM